MSAPATPLLMVPFREVRHFQPDDCLHYEPIEVRGRIHQWVIPAHRHEALHQFEMLEVGSVVATIDGKSYALSAPAAWMVIPGTMHGFVYEPDSVGHVVTVPSVMLQQALAPLPQLGGRLGRPIIVRKRGMVANLDELRELFARLAGEFRSRRAGRAEALRAHAVLLGLWFMRCDAAIAGKPPRPVAGDALVRRFRAQVESHFRARWTVADYAAALGVTPDHLSRRCRAVTGLGARDLVHERLMLEARRRLAYTADPVSEIAHELGFDDPGYFSRLFAKRCGQSPSGYRESVAEGLSALPISGE
jgi:AraC family transcriptional regulator, transcriptional activator of pobA